MISWPTIFDHLMKTFVTLNIKQMYELILPDIL